MTFAVRICPVSVIQHKNSVERKGVGMVKIRRKGKLRGFLLLDMYVSGAGMGWVCFVRLKKG